MWRAAGELGHKKLTEVSDTSMRLTSEHGSRSMNNLIAWKRIYDDPFSN
jgi:hypothetical protein